MGKKPRPQLKPHDLQVELVRGCNMHCDFCGNAALKEEFLFMSIRTATLVAEQAAELGRMRFEIASRGEPTLHKDLVEIIRIFRVNNPYSQLNITTNGILMTYDLAYELVVNGLNILTVDCYGSTYDKFYNRFEKLSIPLYNLREDKVIPWTDYGADKQRVILIEDLKVFNDVVQRTIANQAGAVNPEVYKKYGLQTLTEPLAKRCTKPFRELQVFWNGDIPTCCKDVIGQRILGNIYDISLSDFWYRSEEYNTIRTLLLNKNRNFIPCSQCDFNGGFRQGCIPTVYKILNNRGQNRLVKAIEIRRFLGLSERLTERNKGLEKRPGWADSGVKIEAQRK